ncbi:MAG: MBL fold metallo-hydrolase, partial [Firmicutes bacterium]|nr:MBL fold metallo-hydrolase [Bacillota bacterium]
MELKILLPGIPAFSSRGYLGWSTVVLLQHKGKNILFDVGGHNERLMLVEKLQEQGLTPESVDMVILSHLHYDHAANINLFPQAELVLGRRELEFAATEEGRIHPFIPLGIADYLQKWPSLTLVEGDEKLAEGLT